MIPLLQKLVAITSEAIVSIKRQCELLQVGRGRRYHQSVATSSLDLRLMRLMDEHDLKHFDKGPRRMRYCLAPIPHGQLSDIKPTLTCCGD